jgi:hypothetical protein
MVALAPNTAVFVRTASPLSELLEPMDPSKLPLLSGNEEGVFGPAHAERGPDAGVLTSTFFLRPNVRSTTQQHVSDRFALAGQTDEQREAAERAAEREANDALEKCVKPLGDEKDGIGGFALSEGEGDHYFNACLTPTSTRGGKAILKAWGDKSKLYRELKDFFINCEVEDNDWDPPNPCEVKTMKLIEDKDNAGGDINSKKMGELVKKWEELKKGACVREDTLAEIFELIKKTFNDFATDKTVEKMIKDKSCCENMEKALEKRKEKERIEILGEPMRTYEEIKARIMKKYRLEERNFHILAKMCSSGETDAECLVQKAQELMSKLRKYMSCTDLKENQQRVHDFIQGLLENAQKHADDIYKNWCPG